ncbi:uncharacterized protein LOC143242055 isoform X1 [Tachypleus tridentatus]|uniref:uncharacterized protein LOC143242053 isoform X2 n=1 Tax=Tachypleus tridentatus TaxID=6853 RepID=UPI003FD15263
MKQTFITKSLLPFVTFIISQSVVSQFKVISQKLFDVNVIQISRCDTYGECDSSDEKAPRKWLMNNWALVWAIYKEQPFDDIKMQDIHGEDTFIKLRTRYHVLCGIL